MLLDHEQFLTVDGGHVVDFAAGSQYGAKPYDLKAAGSGLYNGNDPAVGEPLDVWARVTENFNNLTDLVVDLGHDSDGAGTGWASVLPAAKTITLANLTTAVGIQRVGTVLPGVITKRYLTPKLTVSGSTPTTGKIDVWFTKATHGAPANKGVTL